MNKIIFRFWPEDEKDRPDPIKKYVMFKKPKQLDFNQRMALIINEDAFHYSLDGRLSFRRDFEAALKSFKRFQLKSTMKGAKPDRTWVISEIIKLHDGDGTTVSCKIEHALKGYEENVDVFHPNDQGMNWPRLLANRVLLEFPVFTGTVTKRHGDVIQTDVGYGKELNGRGLLIYREPNVTKDASLLGRAEIIKVDIDGLKANLLSHKSLVQPKDRVRSE